MLNTPGKKDQSRDHEFKRRRMGDAVLRRGCVSSAGFPRSPTLRAIGTSFVNFPCSPSPSIARRAANRSGPRLKPGDRHSVASSCPPELSSFGTRRAELYYRQVDSTHKVCLSFHQANRIFMSRLQCGTLFLCITAAITCVYLVYYLSPMNKIN
jgi:hypothetical protein